MSPIKNILFDLGAVLLNLHYEHTDIAFSALVGSSETYQKIRIELYMQGLFDGFERGEVTKERFIGAMVKASPYPLSSEQVSYAWTAMLGDYPAKNLDLLKNLKSNGYRLFLLSNTNSIHLKEFYNIMHKSHGLTEDDFNGLFERAYYSHLIGKRKPAADAFQYVLEDAGIEAKETLFVDDLEDNIETAKTLGLQTLLHNPKNDIVKVLAEHLEISLQLS